MEDARPYLVAPLALASTHPSPIHMGRERQPVPEALVCSAAALASTRLGFSDVSHDSARVFWEATPRPVRLFRVSYVSSKGGHSGQVREGPTWDPMSCGTTAGPGIQGNELSTGGPVPSALQNPRPWCTPALAWGRGSAEQCASPWGPQAGRGGEETDMRQRVR